MKPGGSDVNLRHPRPLRHLLLWSLGLLLASCGMLPTTPIADRAINLNGHCAQTEEDGYRENATLRVQANAVQAMSWQVQVGRRGSCRFELGDFTQTKLRPHAELIARDGSGCKLMVWQEPRKISLAHAGCERRCTAGIYEQTYPVMFDPVSGGCARTQ